MIEWIIGAALLGGIASLLGEKEKSPSATSKLTISTSKKKPVPPPSIDSNSDFSKWRTEWEPTVNLRAWVPNGRSSEIIHTFPPYENGGSAENPIADQSTNVITSLMAKSRLDRCEASLQSEFAVHNANFLKTQKEKLAEFFATIERNPLTDEQMDSCICMDDAVQIIAAAGSGKTSTIVARVGYALIEDLAQPEQILILAFNRSVKEELETRIKERLSDIGNCLTSALMGPNSRIC